MINFTIWVAYRQFIRTGLSHNPGTEYHTLAQSGSDSLPGSTNSTGWVGPKDY